MVSKVTFGLGLGVGYVLGTKAGRERFEQLMNTSRNAWNSDSVQHAKENAQHQASKFYDDGKHVMSDRMNKSEQIGQQKPEQGIADPQRGSAHPSS